MSDERTTVTTNEQSVLNTQDQATLLVPIEVKWNLPAWMMRGDGPYEPIEDDDIDFQ